MPSVTMMNGIERIATIGLTTQLTIVNTTAARIRTQNESP